LAHTPNARAHQTLAAGSAIGVQPARKRACLSSQERGWPHGWTEADLAALTEVRRPSEAGVVRPWLARVPDPAVKQPWKHRVRPIRVAPSAEATVFK